MMMQIKRLLVGKPLESAQQQHQRLTNPIALAVFSSDALSSVAYASEAILGVLILAGSAALPWVIPVSIAIAGLLFIVGLSYRQTIFAYPNGGGAYTVAHENLGQTAGPRRGCLAADRLCTYGCGFDLGRRCSAVVACDNLGFLRSSRTTVLMLHC